MATSTSRLSYRDCYDVFDAALSNERGVKIEMLDYGAGNHFRVRLHTARSIDRKDNRAMYQPDHKLYGRSIYDPIVIRLRQEGTQWWMYLERFDAGSLNIQPLGEEHVLSEATNSNLREAGPSGGSQSGEEASEETHDVFAGEEEREAEPAEAATPAGPVAIPLRRRI
jgi:hypothetical protein